MNPPLPDPHPTDTEGQREPTAQEIADRLIAAVNAAMPKAPTHVKGGGAQEERVSPPPVAQPGNPPMSPRETQIGKVALYAGAGVSMPILAGAVFMVTTEHANPEVIKWIAVAVGCFGAACAAVGYVVKRIVAVVPPAEVHNHFEGPVEHKEINVENVNKWGSRSSTSASN
ncbi:hypothetical protein ACWGNN_00915 [Streptomyces sp. NPDC055817]